MTPERWQRIEALCQAALDQAESQRDAFLDDACAGDSELRREVASLLQYQAPGRSFIETPALEVAAQLAAADQTWSPIGGQIHHYRILSLLGEGGMGKVYLAEDIRLGRQVALKLLPLQFTRDASQVQRFKQEARAIAALNHPNIITIYEIGEVDAIHYIATEFIDGETLRQRMNSNTLTLGEALEISTCVANALIAAHDAGVIHRDIKPENIMVRKDGIVKVLDFGLAKLAEAPAADGERPRLSAVGVKTNTGMVMGTVKYMSPEQARVMKLDARSDLFSLGVVLHEMLSGESPFAGTTSADVIAAILTREPLPITSYLPEAPEALNRIIAKSLRKERTGRYQTAHEMLADLNDVKRAAMDAVGLQSFVAAGWPEGSAEKAGAAEAFSGRMGIPAVPSTTAEYVLKVTTIVAALIVILFTAWSFLPHGNRTPPGTAAITSLAILPFVNQSQDPEQDFYAEGMTDALITQLSPSLRIPGRTTVMQYKGANTSLTEIAANLAVDALVEGSILRSGDEVRITVRLIRPGQEEQIVWGNQYDRDARNMLAVQNEVALDIAREIKVQLSPRAQQRLARSETVDTEAFKYYAKGRTAWSRDDAAGYAAALDDFEKAIEIEEDYADAHVGLANTYLEVGYNGIDLPERVYERARTEALIALRLDSGSADAHFVLASVLNDYDWKWDDSEREFEQGFALNSNYLVGHLWYASHLSALSRFSEAIKAALVARRNDPMSRKANYTLGYTYYLSRDYDRAIEAYKAALDLDKAYADIYEALATVYERSGRPDESFRQYQMYLEKVKLPAGKIAEFGKAYDSGGMPAYLGKLLELNQEDEKLSGQEWPLYSASFYARLGDRGKGNALKWIGKAFDARSPHLQYLAVDPVYDALRSDPQFRRYIERLHLPAVPVKN